MNRLSMRSLGAALLTASALSAQRPTITEEKPGLLKKARISVEAASAAALGRVSGADKAQAGKTTPDKAKPSTVPRKA